MRKGNKSDFPKCLENYGSTEETEPTGVTVKIIDGAAAVQMLKPSQTIRTYGDYSRDLLCKTMKKDLGNDNNSITRIDVVFDRYLETSLKNDTSESRGSRIRISVKEDTPFWKNWQQFLRENENKKELFRMLAEDLVRATPAGSIIVASCETEVRVSSDINTSGLAPCNHEEADTRMFVHIKHAAHCGHRKFTLRTVDTDVVVLSLSFFS